MVSPVSYDTRDIQNTAILSQFLAAWTSAAAVHLYDGPEFARAFGKFDSVLAVDDVAACTSSFLRLRPRCQPV